MKKDIYLISPPFTQLNTPYPATAYLKGFLNTKGISAYQSDLGIDVILKLFSREGLKTAQIELEAIGAGGLSGVPVFIKSTELLKYVAHKAGKRFSIIASGGIFSPDDAHEKLKAGADLVQLYTGFIYEGPGLIKAINKSLLIN